MVQKVPEEFNDDDELDPAARLGRQTLVELRSFGQEVKNGQYDTLISVMEPAPVSPPTIRAS